MAPGVAVYSDPADAERHARCVELAARSGLPITTRPGAEEYEYRLTFAGDRLELQSPRLREGRPICVDFVGRGMSIRRRVDESRLLFRAIGSRARTATVLDATAGLGRDAFVLACHGYQVTGVERSPVLVALLEDGLRRARLVPALEQVLRARLRLVAADARDVLRALAWETAPDVVYLDPMFPPKKKASLVKKEMRILRRVVGDDEDAGELLELARAVARRHVVVKRLRLAPPLGSDPVRAYTGKTTRYDVYAPACGTT